MSRTPTLVATALLVAVPLSAQRDKPPRNAAENCPYCEGDPEVMAAAGVVSHGGFEFGTGTTADVDAFVSGTDVYWIETEHFQLGLALQKYSPPQKEKAKIREELTRLAEVLPEVEPKTRSLDPWLRAHLFGQRMEDSYQTFLDLIQVDPSEFPDGTKPWDTTGEYMGEGPYLGQKGKYEVLVLPSEALHKSWLTDQFGLARTRSQRWNIVERDTLITACHLQEGDNKKDPGLHAHLAFSAGHMFLDGYKHYSYDTPKWLHSGLAHWFGRGVDPQYSNYDSEEGGVPIDSKKWKWQKEILSLVRRGKVPRLAELMSIKSFADADLTFHYSTWSMVTYLIEVHPDGFAKHLRTICGMVDENFLADGSNMGDKHRDSLRAATGLTYAQFDQAWRDWVQGIEPEAEDD